MSMALPHSETVEKYFAELAPFLPAYRHQTVRYLAARTDKGTLLLHLILILSTEPPEAVPAPFRTKNVVCREIPLSETGNDARGLVAALASGGLELAGAHFTFPGDHAGQHTAHAWPFDGARDDRFGQIGRLMVQGDSQRYIHTQNQDFHREVKANAISYESLSALGAAYGLEFQDYMNFCADIYAARVAEVVDLTRDDFSGQLKVRLAPGLTPEEAIISLRSKRATEARARPLELSVSPAWRPDPDGGWRSEVSFGVPDPEAIISAVVSYAGVVQHERDFGPQRTHINSLRVAFAAFEPKEGALAGVLANEKIRDRDPVELERTVAAMLAMRGFNVITADRIPGLQEIPDILAADADGNILVVECTLNLPTSQDKLAKLHRRRETVVRAFAGTRQADTEVIAVLAIPQPAHILQAYQDQARKAQILMLGRDELLQWARDERAANSIEIYAALRERLAMAALLEGLTD